MKMLFSCPDLCGSWAGHCPAKQTVTGSFPRQDTSLGCGFSPWLGAYRRQAVNVSLSHQCFSPSLLPSFPLSLEINKIF